MHKEIEDFFERMKRIDPPSFQAEKVLECGSLDINGNPRSYFSGAKEYIGIDWWPGPKVDHVSLIHKYKGRPDQYFDFVVSSSLLEHDPFWERSITRMVDLVKIGGSLLITCGGVGFHEHELETSPSFLNETETIPSGRYYKNLTVEKVLNCITKQSRFQCFMVEDDPVTKDVRIFAARRMADKAGLI